MDLISKIDNYAKDDNLIARIYNDEVLTYSQLKEKSDALACYIIKKYGEDKKPIVVFGHKEHEMIIAFLACVKAGHPYIPIDNSTPINRVIEIIRNSNCELVINIGDVNLEGENNIHNINKEEVENIINVYSGKIPDQSHKVKDDDDFYIIYTSGSTGIPKGVRITLSCLESFVNWIDETFEFTSNKGTILEQAVFSFDLSIMSLYPSLYTGNTLYVLDKKVSSNSSNLMSSFKRGNISICISTPSFIQMCLANVNFNKEFIGKINKFIFCGEALGINCVKKIQERFRSAKIFNTYGPTEATVAVTSIEIDKDLCKEEKELPIGIVKSDCYIKIIDEEGNFLNDGEIGEIIIIGNSVAKGYYNNKDLTEKYFNEFRFDGETKRYYKTGDLGYLKNNVLFYSGRKDFQIKFDGYRIEIEDIESNIMKIHYIEKAVVIPIKDEEKVSSLTAVVTLNKIFPMDEFEVSLMIKKDLNKSLPRYMIPKNIIINKLIPLNINGKVDRKAINELIIENNNLT